MILGQKGVKYGLQIRKPEDSDKDKSSKPAPPAKNNSVFGDEESDDEHDDVERQIARHAERKKTDKKVVEMQAQALAEDASVFDYDSHFDAIQDARAAPKRQEKVARESRYIASLLQTAEERKKEQDVLYERRLAKERTVEDHLFGDKEKFVTAAYKKKLEEDAKWQAERKKQEQEEEKNAVEKRGHMGDFYRNLFRGNVAFGTAEGNTAAGAGQEAAAAGAVGNEGGTRAGDNDDIMPERRAELASAAMKPPAAAAAATVAAAVEADERRNERSQPAAAQDEGEGRQREDREEQEQQLPERVLETRAAEGQAQEGEALEGTTVAAAVDGAATRQNRDDAVAAARERYLARKRKASGMES